ncbi:MAG: transpeptidase family protein [Odoribacteraceae bacterium]|jgi:cell division protein FtsI (penicillin-binding protein 3)|nr:transpeptidase family protein [Odoribacteraceae bacterium]
MERENGLSLRLAVIYVLLYAVVVPLIIGALLYIQVVEGEKLTDQSGPVLRKPEAVYPDRGNICAEDGRILVRSIPSFELRFDPKPVLSDAVFDAKVDSLAMMLSAFFRDKPASVYRQQLRAARYAEKPDRDLLLTRQRVDHEGLREIKKFPLLRREKKSNKKNSATFASCLKDILHEEREFPYRSLARRTLGEMSKAEDNADKRRHGRVGLELAYEQDLAGKPGLKRDRMMSGVWVPFVEEEPVHGRDVITTIDIDYQYIVHEALESQLKKYHANAGVAILMEVKTGDVKAISNLSRGSDAYGEVLNIAINDAGEPGSTFKAAVMMALLEDRHVRPNDTVDLDSGKYVYSGQTLPESTPGYVGKVTVRQVFERSLNGISRLVTEHYSSDPRKFIDRLYGMQLNKPLGVEILGESAPLIKYPQNPGWSGITLPWMSIGYEVHLTPLQILAFYNALANDGKRVKPRFVKEIRVGDEVVRRVPVEVMNRAICGRETLGYLREMMEGVVENGTARNLRGTAYGIAGKTGTARIADRSRGYRDKKYRASFVGYFPAKEPLYSCIVMIEDPDQGTGYYGNVVSGNVFREISDKVYALSSVKHGRPARPVEKQLPVSKNGYKADLLTLYDALDVRVDESPAGHTPWVMPAREEEGVVLRPRAIDLSVVPNVKGMGLRDALYLLENGGLKVGASGAGMVMKQSIDPGRKVARGSYIHVELR